MLTKPVSSFNTAALIKADCMNYAKYKMETKLQYE